MEKKTTHIVLFMLYSCFSITARVVSYSARINSSIYFKSVFNTVLYALIKYQIIFCVNKLREILSRFAGYMFD